MIAALRPTNCRKNHENLEPSRKVNRSFTNTILKAFAACAFLLPLGLVAQPANQEPLVSTQQSKPSREKSESNILPAPLGGFIPPLTTTDQPSHSTDLFTGSINVHAVYADNASLEGPAALNDYQYSIVPAVGFQSLGAQTQWRLNYGGGITFDQRHLVNSQQAHAGSADVRHEFNQRLIAEVHENYTMTNNPFTQIGAGQSLPAIAGPGQLSSFAVPFPLTRTTNISGADLSYLLTKHSAVGVNGSFSLLHFRDLQALSGSLGGLVDTTDATGRAFYALRISRRQTVGAEYQLQDLKFDGGLARTLDHVLFLFDGFSLTRNTTLSLYAGPEYTHTHNIIVLSPTSKSVIPVLQDQWSLSGGLAYAWRTTRNGVRVSGERRTSDGNGWLGAVRLNTASLELQKAISQLWNATLELIYSDGRGIAIPSNFRNRVTTEEGRLGFLYRLSRNVNATMQYSRVRQPHVGPFTQVIRPDYNEIQIGLIYQFERVLSK
jgi:hypothetical protein